MADGREGGGWTAQRVETGLGRWMLFIERGEGGFSGRTVKLQRSYPRGSPLLSWAGRADLSARERERERERERKERESERKRGPDGEWEAEVAHDKK